MSFIRMGVYCVTTNEAGEVLLSQREDIGIWNLPSGRLDRGETLWAGAAREVLEETGVEVEIVRASGLYYSTRWNRLNICFLAKPIGGQLQGQTLETLDNRWFPPDALPENLYRPQVIDDALHRRANLHVIETPLKEYRHLRRVFARRWVRNLLIGRPEPRFPRFTVQAVGVIQDDNGAIFTYPGGGTRLPRFDLANSSDYTLWQWLKNGPQQFGVPVMPGSRRWVGAWHNPAAGRIAFVFAYRAGESPTANFRPAATFDPDDQRMIAWADGDAVVLFGGG